MQVLNSGDRSRIGQQKLSDGFPKDFKSDIRKIEMVNKMQVWLTLKKLETPEGHDDLFSPAGKKEMDLPQEFESIN